MADRAQDVRELDALGLVARGLAVLPNLKAARRIADLLVRRQEEQALFGLCLLTLEMAVLGDKRARRELPVRVPVLVEAFRDPDLAARLTGGDVAVQARWQRVQPLVGQFMADKHRGQTPTLDTSRSDAAEKNRGQTPTLDTCRSDAAEGKGATREAFSVAGPGAPRVVASPEGSVECRGLTPTESARAAPDQSVKCRGLTPSLEASSAAPGRNEAFWRFAGRVVGRVPSMSESARGHSRVAGAGADRGKLIAFADELLARFPGCTQAEALASMIQLVLASQEQAPGARPERIHAGLSRLGAWATAAEVAALFEVEGEETRTAFAEVVLLVGDYLAFCLAQGLDPLDAGAPARFAPAS